MLDDLQQVMQAEASAAFRDRARRLPEKVITLVEEVPELDEDDSSDEEDEALAPVDHIEGQDFRHGPVASRVQLCDQWQKEDEGQQDAAVR